MKCQPEELMEGYKEKKSIGQVLENGYRCRELFDEIIKLLNYAEGKAIQDVWGLGILPHTKKYKALNRAQKLLEELRAGIKLFEKKIEEVNVIEKEEF